MTTAQVRPRAAVGDIVATILLAAVGLTAGIFLGGLYLIFTPLASWWPLWSLACVAMMVVPVVTGIVGIVRLVKGRRAFWVPLIGLAVVAVLLLVIVLLGMSIEPVLAPEYR